MSVILTFLELYRILPGMVLYDHSGSMTCYLARCDSSSRRFCLYILLTFLEHHRIRYYIPWYCSTTTSITRNAIIPGKCGASAVCTLDIFRPPSCQVCHPTKCYLTFSTYNVCQSPKKNTNKQKIKTNGKLRHVKDRTSQTDY